MGSVLFLIIGFALTAVLGHYEDSMSMGHAWLGRNPLIFYLTAFMGVASMLTLCILLANLKFGKMCAKIAEGVK